jgi:copper(I)-binding protein
MTFLRPAALAAMLLVSLPSLGFADDGLVPAGCPAGAVFTQGGITVSGAFARAMLPHAQSAGGYFTIANTGPDADTLTGASSAAAPDIGIHQMKMNGQVMEMSAVEGGLPIPAGSSVALTPDGFHLMMTGMPKPFSEGACVALTLHFAKAGDLAVLLNVGSVAQDAAPSGGVPVKSSGGMDMSGMSMSQ